MLEHKPSDPYPIRQLLCVAAIADGCMRVMKKGGGEGREIILAERDEVGIVRGFQLLYQLLGYLLAFRVPADLSLRYLRIPLGLDIGGYNQGCRPSRLALVTTHHPARRHTAHGSTIRR